MVFVLELEVLKHAHGTLRLTLEPTVDGGLVDTMIGRRLRDGNPCG
jgi:hypothetical protein